MKRNVIKDFYGRIVGYIETDSKGNQIGKDFYNRKVGSYDAKLDITKDFYGRIIAKGNILVSLLYK